MHQASLLADRPAWLPEALRALVRHEFLTARQLGIVCALPFAEIAPWLDALARERVVVPLARATAATGAGEAAFVLTRRGAALARAVLGLPSVSAPNPKRSLYLLDHELARNDVAVVLGALDRTRALRLVHWETSRAKLADVAHVVAKDRALRVPIVADALAVVAGDDGKPTALLVEVDRGTVSLARMRLKFAAYVAWWKSGGPARRFGTKSLRVVTLAPSPARLERLRDAAVSATEGRGSGLLWFGEQKLVDIDAPERLFDPAWTCATANPIPEHLVLPVAAAEADA